MFPFFSKSVSQRNASGTSVASARSIQSGPDRAVVTSAGLRRLATSEESVKPAVIIDFAQIPAGKIITAVKMDAEEQKSMIALETQSNPKTAVLLLVDAHYGDTSSLEILRRLKQLGYDKPQMVPATADVIAHRYEKDEANKPESAVEDTDIEKLITDLVTQAVDKSASDIHIETRNGLTGDVKLRINGVLHMQKNLTFDTCAGIAQVLFNAGDANSKGTNWQRDNLNDVGITWPISGSRRIQLRFSTSPIAPYGNFHVVMRVLSQSEGKSVDLGDSGYEPAQLALIDTCLGGSTGLFLVCGPVNSGKSTTLAGGVKRIYQNRGTGIKVITAEEPVEIIIPSACQIGANMNMTFPNILKGILRQDADVIVPVEIRDRDVASVVVDMVLSGRKVLTTIHAFSALGAYVRLREMGVPWDLLTFPGFISGILYQRLVPTLCPDCKTPLTASNLDMLPLGTKSRLMTCAALNSDTIHIRGDGCVTCRQTGYVGRTPCAELLLPDQKFLEHLEKKSLQSAESYWRETHPLNNSGFGITALGHAIAKMRAGLLDPVDVENYVGLMHEEGSNSGAKSPLPGAIADLLNSAEGAVTPIRRTGT